ncbi:antibiotic biosynthesis monooxygenase family protein [Simkania sp.]|uniref:antibiotic biosynthesis monooxygenase family protein n=1 Tax=Simkania sp. TaxID=34094 RepID=UPI003B530221
MFAVIYRGVVKREKEAAFRKAWNTVATFFVENRGALGSSLHRAEEGMWVAYSRWPDQATRDASWPKDDEEVNATFPMHVKEAVLELKTCFEDEKPQICMELMDEVVKGKP